MVLQLLKDRKNSIGGYAMGLINMEELGPHQGGNWPFSAEFIKRSFGIAEDKDDPESVYVLTARARSHIRLEQEIREWLQPHCPEAYRALNSLFSPDIAGDRDYEYLVKKSNEQTKHGRLAAEWLTLVRFAIDTLALRLWEDKIMVDYAKRRTQVEDKQFEDQHKAYYERYLDLREEGKGPKAAKQQLAHEIGGMGTPISERRVEQIIEGQRLELGMGKRPPGRPRKDEDLDARP
jgi:hypothetical protein